MENINEQSQPPTTYEYSTRDDLERELLEAFLEQWLVEAGEAETLETIIA